MSRPIATDGVAWSVCWSHSWALQKWQNHSGCRLEGRLRCAQCTTYYMGTRSPKRKGQFCSCPAHWKAL